MNNWPARIEPPLHALGEFLRTSDWYGRENELVNLFAHAFLTRAKGHEPIHPSQLGIEVAVTQLSHAGGKALVRKDLVIWARPNQTLWDRGVPLNKPVAIVEFKTKDMRKCATDIAWLKEYTTTFPSVLGYSVCGFITGPRGIAFRRIQNGNIGDVVRAPAEAGAVPTTASEPPNNALQATCDDARA